MRTPHILTIITCFIGFIVTLSAYFTYKDFETQKHMRSILSENQKKLSDIERHIQDNVLVLNILKTFYDASTFVDRDDFKIFAGALLQMKPAIQALEWVPKLYHKDREAYKKKAIEDGFENYQMVEPTADGKMIPAKKRDVYYPVYYLEPYEGNEVVLGLDPPNLKSRRDAIKQATETGLPAATPAFVLTQEKKHQKGFLIFSPVYETASRPQSIEERHEQLKGLVLMVLRISDMINYTLDREQTQSGATVIDVTIPKKPEILFESMTNAAGLKFTSSKTINVANRQWLISVYPQSIRGNDFFDGISWLVLLVGFSFNGFLTFIIFQLINRRRVVESLVAERTQEVQELSAAMEKTVEGVSVINTKGKYAYTNEAYASLCGYTTQELLGTEWHTTICDDDITDMQDAYDQMFETGQAAIEPRAIKKDGSLFNARITLIKKEDEDGNFLGNYCFMTDITQRKTTEINLKSANEELEEFAYRTSHDLRSPLVSSISLLTLVKKAIEEDNQKVALDCIYHIDDSLNKLDKLVGDILALTRIKAYDEDETFVDINKMVDDALHKMSNMDNFERLQITKKLDFDSPLEAKETRLQLIIENLLSNAIKYQDPQEEKPMVEISTYQNGENFVLSFIDNGLGIPEDQHENLFKMFQRFHARTSYGSGLGLYMMKKSADILSGELIFEPRQKGSIFKLVVPLSKGETHDT